MYQPSPRWAKKATQILEIYLRRVAVRQDGARSIGGTEPRFYFPRGLRYLSPLPFLRPTRPTSWVGSVSVEITKRQ